MPRKKFKLDDGTSIDVFVRHKSEAVHAAEDLGYGRDTVKMIEKAQSSAEINRILKNARIRKFGDQYGRDIALYFDTGCRFNILRHWMQSRY